MIRTVKPQVLCLCLLVLSGLFMMTYAGARDTAAQLHSTPGSEISGTTCIDHCLAACEPDHWYTGLCRGICILGCSPVQPIPCAGTGTSGPLPAS